MSALAVKSGQFELPSGNLMRATCVHRKAPGACGGCYARFMWALDEIGSGRAQPKDLLVTIRRVMEMEVEK